MKIGIIEDNYACISTIKRQLSQLGYTDFVDIFCHGYRYVIPDLMEHRVMLAIVDLDLGGEDNKEGTKVVKDIIEKYPIPTIYCSGLSSDAIFKATQRFSADSAIRKLYNFLPHKNRHEYIPHFNKICDPEELSEVIDLAIANHQLKYGNKHIRKQNTRKFFHVIGIDKLNHALLNEEVLLIKKDENYLYILKTDGNIFRVHGQVSLEQFHENKLTTYREFVRIDRGIILNMNHVRFIKADRTIVLNKGLTSNEIQLKFSKSKLRAYRNRYK